MIRVFTFALLGVLGLVLLSGCHAEGSVGKTGIDFTLAH